MLPGGLPGPRFLFSVASSLDGTCACTGGGSVGGGGAGALNVDGVDNKGGGGRLTTDETVVAAGKLTVGGTTLVSDFFRLRPENEKKGKIKCTFLKAISLATTFSFCS